MEDWYPKSIKVGPEGTPSTYEFLKSVYGGSQHFHYAEFGFWRADTARNICMLFPNATLHLFDYHENCELAKTKLSCFPNRIFFYGNTQRFNDSYNWSLIQLLVKQNHIPLFDYCFLDGAHTFAVDALTFFMCDKLLNKGGYIDFDDYNWRLRNSSLDPSKVPSTATQYTEEQINSLQVKMIVDNLVKKDPRYQEVLSNKIYQKLPESNL
jgi:hypothetical protein